MATPESIAHYLLRSVKRAVRDFALIAPEDRIAVGVSGGKDSRALLELFARGVELPGGGSYEVVAVHVDTMSAGLPDRWPALQLWLETLGISYKSVPLSLPPAEVLPLDCFRCARLRRKALFVAARELGCNKVALGHHADDAAITTLLSILYKGSVESLAPRREFFNGELTLIRPMIYVTEDQIRRYARASGWESLPAMACPRQSNARRDRTAAFLQSFPKREQKQMRANLVRLGQCSGENSHGSP